jgi:hypothetical protein
MYQITLINDGAIVENNRVVTGDPLMFLSYRLELKQDYTLRGFFRMFEKYPLLSKLNAFLPDCLQRYRACPENRCVTAEIDYLQFHKTVEMIGFPGDPRLEIYNTLCGVRGPDTRELKSFHLESLLDMPLKLGNLKHVVFGDKVDVFEFETVFSLFEFIDGIIWELSFQGTPKQCAI